MTERPGVAVDDRATQRGRRRSEHGEIDERRVLESVRAGDLGAFASIYDLHRTAVERLARRLCVDRHEADDVVAEVFCNTMRALLAGKGPTDDARPYLLRSVRHTVIKLRTRKDSGRTTAMPPETLDRPSSPAEAEIVSEGLATEAWRDVAPRFQEVLWSIEVQGYDTADIAAQEDIAPPAAASLVHRARRALRRSYLQRCIRTPSAGSACDAIRPQLAAYVDDGLASSNVARIDRHIEGCGACSDALSEVHEVYERLGSRAWLLLFPAALRALVDGGARAVGAFAGNVPAAVTIGLAGASLTHIGPEVRPFEIAASTHESAVVHITDPPVTGSGASSITPQPPPRSAVAVEHFAPRPVSTSTHNGAAEQPTDVETGTSAGERPGTAVPDGDEPVSLPATPTSRPSVTGEVPGLDRVLEPVVDHVLEPVVEPVITEVVAPALDALGEVATDAGHTVDSIVERAGTTVDTVTAEVADGLMGDQGVVDTVGGRLPVVDSLTDVAHPTTVEVGRTVQTALGQVDVSEATEAVGGRLDQLVDRLVD